MAKLEIRMASEQILLDVNEIFQFFQHWGLFDLIWNKDRCDGNSAAELLTSRTEGVTND